MGPSIRAAVEVGDQGVDSLQKDERQGERRVVQGGLVELQVGLHRRRPERVDLPAPVTVGDGWGGSEWGGQRRQRARQGQAEDINERQVQSKAERKGCRTRAPA